MDGKTTMTNGKITHEVGQLYSEADGCIHLTKVYGNVDVVVISNYWKDSSTFEDGEWAVTAYIQLNKLVGTPEQFRDGIRYINLAYRALRELGFEFHKMIEDGVALFHQEGSAFDPKSL